VSVSEMVEQTGVLLIDDDVFARNGLKAAIEAEPSLAVAGEAGDCASAMKLATAGRVRVVIMKASPQDPRCAALTRELARTAPDVAVIVIGRSDFGSDVLPLVQAGVAAYLDRAVSADALVSAVQTVADGGHVLDPQALSGVVKDYVARCDRRSGSGAPALTRREREVLTLVARGASTKQIATDLLVSHKTVEVHRQRIMDKLGLHKVADLVRYALREGLVGLDEA
jgi:DNA-binding NarL/FixJ family response regulator